MTCFSEVLEGDGLNICLSMYSPSRLRGAGLVKCYVSGGASLRHFLCIFDRSVNYVFKTIPCLAFVYNQHHFKQCLNLENRKPICSLRPQISPK